MYIDSGKKLSKKQLGTPYLLRDNDEQPKLLNLSLVVPAYNEEQRLPHMLATHIKFLQEQQRDGKMPGLVEIVIVDDGSRDKTWAII